MSFAKIVPAKITRLSRRPRLMTRAFDVVLVALIFAVFG